MLKSSVTSSNRLQRGLLKPFYTLKAGQSLEFTLFLGVTGVLSTSIDTFSSSSSSSLSITTRPPFFFVLIGDPFFADSFCFGGEKFFCFSGDFPLFLQNYRDYTITSHTLMFCTLWPRRCFCTLLSIQKPVRCFHLL